MQRTTASEKNLAPTRNKVQYAVAQPTFKVPGAPPALGRAGFAVLDEDRPAFLDVVHGPGARPKPDEQKDALLSVSYGVDGRVLKLKECSPIWTLIPQQPAAADQQHAQKTVPEPHLQLSQVLWNQHPLNQKQPPVLVSAC